MNKSMFHRCNLNKKNVKNHINTKLQTRQLKSFEYIHAQKNVHECTFFCAFMILSRQNEQDLPIRLNLTKPSADRSLWMGMPLKQGLPAT